MNHYEEAYDFFEECQTNNKKVLVHCYMGSSRSASTIIYYMIRKYNYSFDDAFQYLKERRPHVNLNTNFESELRQYEQLQQLHPMTHKIQKIQKTQKPQKPQKPQKTEKTQKTQKANQK
jgi:protein-tyrosine phosphatase